MKTDRPGVRGQFHGVTFNRCVFNRGKIVFNPVLLGRHALLVRNHTSPQGSRHGRHSQGQHEPLLPADCVSTNTFVGNCSVKSFVTSSGGDVTFLPQPTLV